MSQKQDLLAHLSKYQSTDQKEIPFQKRMIDLLKETEAPFSRSQFAPGHFTASSFLLSPDKKKLLLIFHKKLKRWLQPGGHVEPEDNSILQAAKREVSEETNVSKLQLFKEGILDIDIHEIPPLKNEPAHEHFDVRFLFIAEDLNMLAGSDALDAKWFPLEEIESIESDLSVMRAVTKIKEMLS